MLNNNFVPIMVCSAKRAIIMVWTGKAEIVKSSGMYVRSVSMSIDIPLIIRLLVFVTINKKIGIQLSKQNIIRRDRGVCQYCGKSEGHMTIDHVVPKSHGGRDTWENLVCACPECNNLKGDRTPLEAGMTLIKSPKKPNIGTFLLSHKITVSGFWHPYIKLN